jgi:hypothetical protein
MQAGGGFIKNEQYMALPFPCLKKKPALHAAPLRRLKYPALPKLYIAKANFLQRHYGFCNAHTFFIRCKKFNGLINA